MEVKKVSFVIGSLAGGGAEGVCVNIANGLFERGWQVDIVVMNLDNEVYLDRVLNGVNVISLNVAHARNSLIPLMRYVRKSRADKIAVFNYELAVIMVFMKIICRYKFKLIARNINTISNRSKNLSGFWRRYVVSGLINFFYSRVDHVVNQCVGMEQDLLKVFPSLKGRTSVIYNPVNRIVESAAVDMKFSTIERENYFLCVGRLEKQKSFNYAISAFARIAARYKDVRLKIIGQGSLEFSLKELVAKSGFADRVDFEGFKKDMIPYYARARATVLSSLYEGFPNILVESISLGTPVVSFDCPSGPSEIIVDGVNGFLVEYLNVEKLAVAMEAIVTSGQAFDRESVMTTSFVYSNRSIISKYDDLLMSF